MVLPEYHKSNVRSLCELYEVMDMKMWAEGVDFQKASQAYRCYPSTDPKVCVNIERNE